MILVLSAAAFTSFSSFFLLSFDHFRRNGKCKSNSYENTISNYNIFYLFLAITDTGSEENSDQQHQNKPGLSSGTPKVVQL